MAFSGGRILACGPWSSVSAAYPDAVVLDARDSLLLPGFVDCHVHYPQVRVIGAMGLELMDWLRLRALPEEARLADSAYAAEVASEFVRGLAAAGTTTALVFGSHFPGAQAALFRRPLCPAVFGSRVAWWSLTGGCCLRCTSRLRRRWMRAGS